jgi:hypothetical protein
MRTALWMAVAPLLLCSCTGTGEGFLTVTWQIELDGVASDCSEVRADTVLVYGEHFPDEFGKSAPCVDGTLTTSVMLPTGFWNIYPALYNENSVLADTARVISIDGDREMEIVFAVPLQPEDPQPADPLAPTLDR